jgi:hypothetical protein
VTAPILALGTALINLTVKSAASGNELGDIATNLGISAKALQEWNYVAKQWIASYSSTRLKDRNLNDSCLLGFLKCPIWGSVQISSLFLNIKVHLSRCFCHRYRSFCR